MRQWTHRARGQDTIDASTQEEAQQLIRQKGFFRHQDRRADKAARRARRRRKKGKGAKKKSFTIGKISTKQSLHLHPPALDLAGRRPAYLAQSQNPRKSGKPGVLKNA